MLSNIISSKKYGGTYNLIDNDTRSGLPTAVFGVSFAEKCGLISSLNSPVLFIVRDSTQAKNYVDEISALTGEKVVYLPPKDDLLLFKSIFNKDSMYKRLTALYEISNGVKIVVTTFESLMGYFPKKIESITLKKGEEYDLYSLVEKLVKLGYTRVDFSEKKGDFSLRGDILEVFPINSEEVYKLDFFGDEIEKIRLLGKEVEKISILQASDVFISNEEVGLIKEELKKAYSEFSTLLVKSTAKNLYSKIATKLETDLYDDCLQYIFPLIENKTHDVFDIIDKNSLVVFDESKILYSNLISIEKQHNERCESLLRTGDGLAFIKKQMLSQSEVLEKFSGKRMLAVQSLSSTIPFFNPLKTYNISSSPIQKYFLNPNGLYADVENWKLTGYKVIICANNEKQAKQIYYDLIARKIYAKYKLILDENLDDVNVTICPLDKGFIRHETKLVIIGAGDIFNKKPKEKGVKKKRGDLFTAPNVGDFAVHENFGVGLVKGVKKISTIEGTSAYIELEYKDGDRLYVSTDQMDKLSKYLGGSSPTLNKIGGGEFERIKERVKKSILNMTINLKKLYAKRKESKGFTFSEDNALSYEFDNSFEFEETEDQLISIEEIKRDMESSKVMDRLLCGDVGFGKTEVALRACFKAVLDGKQAAIIAPTTILTEQHFMTAQSRFKNFGVRIAVLNRFRTPAYQNKILEEVKEGKIDVIIGTHRLFSKDVKFKDLGLLVIDEEQRFGVEHKEKLKLLKENVDTLTLSATPIPRTLHLSLSGIRDISTINTPPKQRLPVQTVVTELSDSLIKDAIIRELARDGQVFVLYNRVDTIYKFAERISQLVPESKVIVAHGQMKERELENNISSFYRGEGNVLVATTIIENGIDMPRANTLIVESSDTLGLSTLYQLKGRVGRGNLLAYAYFTYNEGKILTEQAYQRLEALMEYTEMGSGYKIAMRDLEIRGAGSVLGKEQHGHMDKVGYELYNKLLKEQLGERTMAEEVELEIKADAYIPDEYIANESARMDAYKQIAEIENLSDRERIENSLIDNYGKIPTEVKTLIDIAWLKVKAEEAGVIKISVSMHVGKLTFNGLESFKDGKIVSRVNENKGKVSLYFEKNPMISFMVDSGKPSDYLKNMIEFLTF